jgi:hypothetical protein
MINGLFLLWVLVAPDGSSQFFMQKEPTIEQCKADGQAMAVKSDAMKEAGAIIYYAGACHQEGKEPAGST